jgi:hypothetical protein
VFEDFRGAEGKDTLYLLEDSGFECHKGLSHYATPVIKKNMNEKAPHCEAIFTVN